VAASRTAQRAGDRPTPKGRVIKLHHWAGLYPVWHEAVKTGPNLLYDGDVIEAGLIDYKN
jgi:hypothetical protein